MDAAQVKAMVETQLKDCDVEVSGEGANYDITVVGEAFAGLRALKRQQLVFAALTEQISNGSIHAVNIATYTPGEWQAR